MSNFNLIMISAVFENGGNTTHRLLDGHPQLFVYPFESQVGTGYSNDYLASFTPIRYRWPEFPSEGKAADDYEMYWDEELRTYLRVRSRSKFRDCGLEMDETKRKARYVELVDQLGRSRAHNVEAFFRSTFDTWTNYNRTGKEVYHVGYNPVQALDAEKFFADFPKGHMIHVVRNPFSGYADQFRRPFPPSLHRYAHTWAYNQLLALTFRDKFPGQFHIVRFEDIIGDMRATMTKLQADIGLEISDTCLYPSFNGKKLDQVTPWGTIRTPTTTENMATANELTDVQKEEVRKITSIMLKAFGYENFLATGKVSPIAL